MEHKATFRFSVCLDPLQNAEILGMCHYTTYRLVKFLFLEVGKPTNWQFILMIIILLITCEQIWTGGSGSKSTKLYTPKEGGLCCTWALDYKIIRKNM